MGHKYNAQRTEVDGFVFDSKREARRYQELQLLERAGQIEHLELQPIFDISVNGQKICKYIADFRYMDLAPGSAGVVVEDSKGVKTDVYKLKKKLVKAVYGIDVKEV